MVTTDVIIAEVMQHAGHRAHVFARVSDAEVLTVAVVAAASFPNHHARALQVLLGMGYLSGQLSASRCNRRLHGLATWRAGMRDWLGELVSAGEVFGLDSLPLPVCRRARARRGRKVRGRA